jgi:hypothetical protein
VSDGFSGNLGEWTGYLGVPLLVLAAAATVWLRRQLVVRWAAAMALAMFVLSLGPTLHVGGHATSIPLPWRALGHLPLLDSVLPGRMSLYVFLCLALLLACGLDALLRRRRVVTAPLAGIAFAAAAIPLLPALPFASRPASIPAVFSNHDLQSLPRGSVAYVLPAVNQDAMLWQVESGMRWRMLGGWFFGPDAQGHVQQGPPSTPLTRAVADVEMSGDVMPPSPQLLSQLRAELRADGVRAIVLTPQEPHADAVAQFFRILTGTPPRGDAAGGRYWLTG